MCKMQCVNGSASWTSWTDQLDVPAGQTSSTDQLDRPVLFIWSLGQFLSFQFVHCRSFRVRRRPCFFLIWKAFLPKIFSLKVSVPPYWSKKLSVYWVYHTHCHQLGFTVSMLISVLKFLAVIICSSIHKQGVFF